MEKLKSNPQMPVPLSEKNLIVAGTFKALPCATTVLGFLHFDESCGREKVVFGLSNHFECHLLGDFYEIGRKPATSLSSEVVVLDL